MKTSSLKPRPAGYVSFLLVLSMGSLLMVLMVFAYRRATTAQVTQATVQLQVDYSEKEEAILRSIVAITPNRAIRSMQHLSNSNPTVSNPLRWENIFTEALVLANARQSISSQVLASLGTPSTAPGNSGDSALGTASLIFKALGAEAGYVSAGNNRTLGTGYPVPLTCGDATDSTRDMTWPIISSNKVYGALAQAGVTLPVGTYPNFNIINYPNINFGYARPGQPFVAKRNWWGFSVDLAEHDTGATRAVTSKRNFVLSIYEIPSQLAISASSFMELGQHASGEAWADATITGGVFTGRAVVDGTTALSALATRRGSALSATTTVGGQSFNGDPFEPGVREAYQLTQGDFFPVSLASESGRAAFIPINRGADYFDRLAHSTESSVLSSTTWNNYSIGALQCAMRLDVTQSVSAINKTPTILRFSYFKGGVRQNLTVPLTTGVATGLPPGYIYCCDEDKTYNFGTTVVDVAYGKNGTYAYQAGVSGSITFNNARFGDPLVGVFKAGYFRPSYPFEVKALPSGKICLAVYPKRFAAFLTALRADSTAVNHSLVVNVDYTVATGSAFLTKPSIPCTDLDYGVILQECNDLTSFTKGFSLVTNLRLYIGDDFNVVSTAPPAGYTPPGLFYPPCSLFAPEKRFGVEMDPFGVSLAGQVGSLASETAADPVRPLDAKAMSGSTLAANRIHVNLHPITHPSELPPISMMNWLVLLEERRREYYP
ncbi:MAG: hypothetical protein NTW21_34330 [Verrucomicrobia bacterium]|nr:hypothetical protein [Verrucomicrobiota bacterium]